MRNREAAALLKVRVQICLKRDISASDNKGTEI